MARTSESVEAHYRAANLGESILDALKSMGKDLGALTPTDLAPVDEFHIRGRESTMELARLAEAGPGMDVLDVGCGIGGSARFLAAEYGCAVTGLDITPGYCEVAAMLSNLVGLDGMTRFQQGSALDMPFESECFDLVWTEHTQMNIADKEGFYSEIARVLRPGGRLAFHDVFEGEGGALYYPVPWAGEPSICFLIGLDELGPMLESVGLRVRHWEDTTRRSAEWFRRSATRARPRRPMPLGLQLLMGADSGVKFQNVARNLEEDRIAVLQAVLEKAI